MLKSAGIYTAVNELDYLNRVYWWNSVSAIHGILEWNGHIITGIDTVGFVRTYCKCLRNGSAGICMAVNIHDRVPFPAMHGILEWNGHITGLDTVGFHLMVQRYCVAHGRVAVESCMCSPLSRRWWKYASYKVTQFFWMSVARVVDTEPNAGLDKFFAAMGVPVLL